MSYHQKNYFALGYRPGSIIRVKVKNFLTYDECEVFPGPKLNVVIGPNGSGKSTLTHAICLACCGSTSDIGRAHDLAKFVKRGKTEEEAFVEVDILEHVGSLVTLRRTINAQSNSSKWTINGFPRPLAEAKKIIANFSIDVDNLCSFMPQDKVGKFTQYTPKEVLQNTLKSISGGEDSHDLYQLQQELSDSQTHKDHLRKTKESKALHKESLQKQMESLSLELNRLKEKEKAKEDKKFCEMKLLKVKGSDYKKSIQEKKQEMDNIINQIMQFNEKMAPYEFTLREYKKLENKLNKQENSVIENSMKLEKDIQEQVEDMNNIEEDKDRYSVELANFELLFSKEKDELEKKKVEYQKLILKKKEVEKHMAIILSDSQDTNARKAEISHQQDNLLEEMKDIDDKKEAVVTEIRELNTQISSLQDSREIFKKKLSQRPPHEKMCHDTVRAMNYLDENLIELRRNGSITGEVIGPIALHIDTHNDMAIAAMMEQIIPLNRLLGFIVTNDSDSLFLKNLFRKKMNIGIDFFTIKHLTPPKLPYSMDVLQRIKRSMPFINGYLADQIATNDHVKSFLYSFQAFNLVLWGRGKNIINGITKEHLNSLCPPGTSGFRLFVHDEGVGSSSGTGRTPSRGQSSSSSSSASEGYSGLVMEFNGKKSRYAPDAPPSTASYEVQRKGLITDSSDSSNLMELKQQLSAEKNEKTQQYNELMKISEKLKQKMDAFNHEILVIKQKQSEIAKLRGQPAQFDRQMANLQKEIDHLEKKLTQEVYLKEKKIKQNHFAATINNLLESIETITETVGNYSKKRIPKRVCHSLTLMEKEKIKYLERELHSLKQEIHDLRKQKESKEREISRLQEFIQQVTIEMNQCIEEYGGIKNFTETIFPKVIEVCPENSIEEIEDRILAIETKLKSIIDNPLVIERYNNLEREFDIVSEELEKAEKELENAELSLQLRSDEWLNQVKCLTQKLNVSFKKYMNGLNFQGDIVLKETGKFCDYEMQLRVAFRQDAPLADLSGARHSGGERAVSTIMFLMALQKQTSSPFRVVDEINQGMDERNERLVFDRIVKSCCYEDEDNLRISSSSSSSSSSENQNPQYFLVTPKLLQGLKCLDHENVTVLCIWNGPGVTEKWNLSTILESLLRKRANNGGIKSEKRGSVLQTKKETKDDDDQEEDWIDEAEETKPRGLKALRVN